jgi:hypothetical protein
LRTPRQGYTTDPPAVADNAQSIYLMRCQGVNFSLEDGADMAICEAQYGTPDWYDRFGFIYFEFMRDAYKRKD